MLVSELASRLRARLETKFPKTEAREMVNIIFENLKGWTMTDVLVNGDRDVTDYIVGKANDVVEKVLENEPIQYVFGSAHFYGMVFKVNRSTLIPRQETAQLVDMIVKDWDGTTDLQVLDLGTGSGCIAIALARNLPFAAVTGVDISEDALKVAAENADKLRAKVKLLRADMLSLPAEASPHYDIIVSNPPYIAESEAAQMDRNVLDYQPHTALFVPDADPLKFYKAAAVYAKSALKPGGKIYFEINPLFANDLVGFMEGEGWTDVTLERDMQKQYRFLVASHQ